LTLPEAAHYFDATFPRIRRPTLSKHRSMRLLLSALCIACLSVVGLRADEERQQPEEIPNFNQLDEYIYVPKSTLSLGPRLFLKGPKATYSGQGSVPSLAYPGPDSTVGVPNISRTYIDGKALADTRTIPSSPSGGVGQSDNNGIASDGRTNTWGYDNASQFLSNGDMALHTYAGYVTDTGVHPVAGVPTSGIELIMDRDMGKIGKHMTWSMTAGFSIADIHSSAYASVPTTMVTLTDTYDLFGQVPPAPPYTSPHAISQPIVNSSGQTVSGTGTTAQTQEVDQTIFLGNRPLGRNYTTTQTFTENRYFIEGAYYTLRLGPTVIFPVGQHFKLTMSAGPTLLYAGSVYNVLEDFIAAPNEEFTKLYQKENTRILPGYYVDVDLRYDITEAAGLYVGAIYQGAGGYNQAVASGTLINGSDSTYGTHVDFGNQQGVKGGLTVRF
jgi:hypothetical protein